MRNLTNLPHPIDFDGTVKVFTVSIKQFTVYTVARYNVVPYGTYKFGNFEREPFHFDYSNGPGKGIKRDFR